MKESPTMNRTRLAARAAAVLERTGWHTIARRADVTAVDGDDLALRACIVPWNTAARVTDDGRRFYDETWEPGSLVDNGRVIAYEGHVPGTADLGAGDGRRNLLGRVDSFTAEHDGLYGMIHVAPTARGRDVLALARTLGYVDVSLEADVPAHDGDTVVRSAGAPVTLTGVAVILPPGMGAFPGAVAIARAATPTEPDEDQEDAEQNDDEDTPTETATRASVAELVRAEVARINPARRSGSRAAAHPFARYANLRELVGAARSSTSAGAELSAAFNAAYRQHVDLERAARTAVGRAFVDQVTTDNPGLIPPAWITEVFGIIDEGRPGITALGGPRSPGPSGMDVNWPYYAGDLSTIVAQQLTEKSDINSVKVSFLRGTATLDTYAGGSDVSYQLQRRSSPGYMALYDRILQMAYGLTTETVFDADVSAAAAAPPIPLDLTADTDGSATRAALFAASSRVKAATGSPASVALASSDVFGSLGGSAWLQAPQYGTANVAGTTSASTLRINISGLEVVEAPGLPVGTIIVTNPGAAAWLEEGPFLATAEDISKLGTDVAIWGMGVTAPFVPAGIVRIAVTMTFAATSSTKPK